MTLFCACADTGAVYTWGLNMCGRPADLSAVAGATKQGALLPAGLSLHTASQVSPAQLRCLCAQHSQACFRRHAQAPAVAAHCMLHSPLGAGDGGLLGVA